MKILIGSKALSIAGSKYINPKINRSWDFDWIGTFSAFEEHKQSLQVKKAIPRSKKTIVLFEKNNIHEFEIAWLNSSSRQLLDIAKSDPEVAFKHPNGIDYVATPNLVFALKKSHRFLRNSPHFLKTMQDYFHLMNLGCYIPDSIKPWYKQRVKETYDYKHPRLKNVSKKDFFKDDMVPYKYDHDTIHLAVKHLERPAYDYFKHNTAEVECSKELFDKCSNEVKLYSVLEEAYVLALERSQIPNNYKVDRNKSFNIALMKVCTSITSGWWREFAYENYFKVLDIYSDTYVDNFFNALNSGIVKNI